MTNETSTREPLLDKKEKRKKKNGEPLLQRPHGQMPLALPKIILKKKKKKRLAIIILLECDHNSI